MNNTQKNSQFLIYTAAFIIVVAGIKGAQSIVAPFLLAVFISVISAPFVFWLEKLGLRRFFAFLVVVIIVMFFMSIVLFFVWGALNNFITKLPTFQSKLYFSMEKISEFLATLDISFNPKEDIPTELQPGHFVNAIRGFLSSFGKLLSNSFIIFLMVAFILFETTSISDKARIILGRDTEKSIAIYGYINALKRFLFIRTIASVATGIFISISLWFVGIENAIFWGIVAFFLNYIPVIGSIVAAIPPIMITFIEHSFGITLIVMGIYLLANISIGSIIEPRFLGRGLGLSPLVVLISLIFWGFALGPIGMFLAVPITMSVKIILEINPKTRWIAILLGGNVRKKLKKIK